VCDKIDWMENGWMENGLSGCGCGKWMDVESGKWRGSGSHICVQVCKLRDSHNEGRIHLDDVATRLTSRYCLFVCVFVFFVSSTLSVCLIVCYGLVDDDGGGDGDGEKLRANEQSTRRRRKTFFRTG